MESQRYGRQLPILNLPYFSNAGANALGDTPLWGQQARRAFEEWADHMRAIVPDEEIVWFAADAGGAWCWLRFGPGTSNVERDLGKHAAAAAMRLMENGQALLELPLADGTRVLAAALNTGATIMAVGAVLPPGYNGELTALNVYHLAAGYTPYLYLQLEKTSNIRFAKQQQLYEKEARKRELLFQMANELYSKNDTDEILAEIIRRIQEFYPESQIDLLMTQDHDLTDLPVKPLRFNRLEEDSCTKAFMEGQIVIDACCADGDFEMAVPISGKQGIYGVLHLHNHAGPFEPSDIQIMKVLSSAAGSAFENAKLYEQSNVLVNELRLINELTKQLNQSLKLNDIFSFSSTELTHIFHADYCCILQLDKSKNEFTVQATNMPAMLHESFPIDYGFSGIVFESKEPVIVSDYWSNAAVQSKLMQLTGARSLIATPFIVHDEVHGVILVAHRIPGYFTYDNYKLLQVLAGHIGLALANASLHAEVRRMVITDNLTGLYARHYLNEQIGLLQKKDFCGSLIVVDIDHFKKINDTYGHQIGDKILIEVSRIIKGSIRDSDIAARWGGEELAIYLPQVTTEQAVRIAERIRERVKEDTDPSVTVSCGISEWNWQDEKISVESLFYRSDMALYRAKHEGRNRIKVG